MKICTRKIILSLILCLSISFIHAQNTQTLRGIILDKDTHETIIGATIAIIDTELGTSSDENGRFRFDELTVGRYQIQVSSIGYQSLVLSEILLEAGKETILNIELEETANDLQTIEVSAPAHGLSRNDVPLSIHTLTIEETRRFPANFNDPVRLAVSLAGVSQNNDQANGISIRGNSPNNMGWRLEGAEIVNPNHLSNAGTFSDRPTANGGGVNILSAQLLGTSNFLKSAFPVGFGNALSGVMDMHLRAGNEEQREFTAEIGLLGIDVAAEGPFSKSSKASYLVNYRYSTVGLLDALGVPLGDESIAFQDVAFNVNLPLKKGNLNVFGLGGLSKNTFEAERDTSLWEYQKDNQDIRFENLMGALGVSFQMPVNKQVAWNTSVVFSALEATRESDYVKSNLMAEKFFEQNRSEQQKLSGSTHFLIKINPQSRIKLGTNATNYHFSQHSKIQFFDTTAKGIHTGLLLQPFANWQYINNNWTANIGLQYNYFSLNQSDALEPRASLRWDFHPKQNLAISYGLYSQLQRPEVYASTVTQNQELDFTKAHHFVLGYSNYLTNSTKLSIETYYQSLFDVPIVNAPNRTFSTLNIVDYWISEPLGNTGSGTNYGIEASLQRHIQGSFYYLINATYYRSLYVAGDGVERSTRFDGKYIANATFGKEWSKNKKGKDKTWGANARLTYLGGYRDTPIDVTASAEFGWTGWTVYEESQAFSLKQKDYFKVDLRFYYRKNKGKRSSTIALDLQNTTNQENVAFSYFDTRKQEVVVKNQLGLIPNLSYRMQF